MKSGVTMIELIFVILIIGVLAGLAIGRLSAVRDDALIAKDMQNMSQCITDAGAWYTSKGVDVKAGDLVSCDSVVCYTITFASGAQNFTVQTDSTGAAYCANIDAIGAHLAKTYTFKGSSVSY